MYPLNLGLLFLGIRRIGENTDRQRRAYHIDRIRFTIPLCFLRIADILIDYTASSIDPGIRVQNLFIFALIWHTYPKLLPGVGKIGYDYQ